MWALLPQQMVLHCSFSCAFYHNLSLHSSRLHVRLVFYTLLCVCCRIFVIYICVEDSHLHVVLVCIVLTGCSGLKTCRFSLSLIFICLYCPLHDTDLHCLVFFLMFKPRRSSSTVFLCVCVHILFRFVHSFLCIIFITQHAREPYE